MDPLSDVFLDMRVKTSVHARLEFTAPWALRFEGYEHAHFGVVTRGCCYLSLAENGQALELAEGDCWLLPRGDTHVLSDSPTTRARPYAEVRKLKLGGLLRYGGDGAATTVICGNFTFEARTSNWLTEALPALITFRMDQDRSSATEAILQLLAAESETERMGSAIVVGRLADILFVQAIRAHAAHDESPKAGWLRAIGHRQLSVALRAMHEGMEKRWTVASLASAAGMSRSAFADLFKQVLGESPMEYLTRWRMYKAAQLLSARDLKIAQVASLVGYESDGAFNKAFKRNTGIAPGAYRKDISRTLSPDQVRAT